jgi:hypothetical protein
MQMSRTTRKVVTDSNYREVRKGKGADWATLPGARINYRFRGGMVMSESSCSFWKDERYRTGPSRDLQRRAEKRSKRQKVMQEAINDFLQQEYEELQEMIAATEVEYAEELETYEFFAEFYNETMEV